VFFSEPRHLRAPAHSPQPVVALESATGVHQFQSVHVPVLVCWCCCCWCWCCCLHYSCQLVRGLPALVAVLQDNTDPPKVLEAVTSIRKLLSIGECKADLWARVGAVSVQQTVCVCVFVCVGWTCGG
jgi:hypothetical protein